jgi:hypothetical protein
MGLARKLRHRAAAVRLALAGDLFDARAHAETELGALAGLRAAAREMIAAGYELRELVGMVAPDGEVRLLARSVVREIHRLRLASPFEFPQDEPPGTLLVVSERDGEPLLQFIEVT